MLKNLIVAAVTGVLLTGCVTQSHQMQTPFRPADFEWSTAKGTATLSGQAFLKTRGGEVRTCAGNNVALVPDNAYTRELVQASRERKDTRQSWDPRYPAFRRTAICDAQGRFTFKDLPAGQWLLGTSVVWEAPGYYGLNAQGGGLGQFLWLAEGEKKEVILTDRDRL